MSPTNRRRFLRGGLVAAGAAVSGALPRLLRAAEAPPSPRGRPPVVISSANGLAAAELAFQRIEAGEDPLDAVIAGVNLVEDDPDDMTVGLGGLPNEEGVVELDASCMHGPSGRGGGVAALRRIRNPSRVARLVAFRTDHVLLVGEGALRFARAHGFVEEDLLTDAARREWLRWKENLSDEDDWLPPEAPLEDSRGPRLRPRRPTGVEVDLLDERAYGTIHCGALTAAGDLAAVTTTSGLAYKIPGRVGDSPILGAGIYVDNAVGTCGSTGRGEENLQRLCSFHAVDLLRRGRHPVDAGLEVLRRVAEVCEDRLRDSRGRPAFGLKFYLLDKKGRFGGVSLHSEAQYAVCDREGARLLDCAYLYERRRDDG